MEQTHTDDLELLRRWRAGCRKAGDVLIDRHAATVHRFFRHRVNAELDDLVQQTFLACVEAQARFREESSFRTYLLAIARYQLFACYGQRRRESLDLTLQSMLDMDATPTHILASRERSEQLVSALRQLPPEAQEILEWTYAEELSGPQIARALDIPVNTVYSRLRRAKRSLRELLERECPEFRGDEADTERAAS